MVPRKVKGKQMVDFSYGTHRAVPTCKRCHEQHYNMIPCRDQWGKGETNSRNHRHFDPQAGNPAPQRVERHSVPDGFRERDNILRTVTLAPGNRYYLVRDGN